MDAKTLNIPEEVKREIETFAAEVERLNRGEVGDDDRVPGAPGRFAAAPERQWHAAAQPALAVRPGGRPGPAGAAPAPG